MTPVLALQSWEVAAIVLATASATVLLLIVIAPWRSIRQEPPLDDEVESRILLGDDPAAIAEEEAREDDVRAGDEVSSPSGPNPAA